MDNIIIEVSGFRENVLNFGTEIPPEEFTIMMLFNLKNKKNYSYSPDRLLKISKRIFDKEMQKLSIFDDNNLKCLIILKHKNSKGLIMSYMNRIKSFTESCFSNTPPKVSKKWAILSYNEKSTILLLQAI